MKSQFWSNLLKNSQRLAVLITCLVALVSVFNGKTIKTISSNDVKTLDSLYRDWKSKDSTVKANFSDTISKDTLK